MKKTTQIALACALSIGALAPTLAQAELTYNVGVISTIGTDDYRAEDDPKSSFTKEFKPQVTFGVDYAFGNGFYLSNANTTGKWAEKNEIEIALTAGYGNELANGLSYDLSVSRYVYPKAGAENGNEANLTLGFAGVSASYTKPFINSQFEGAYTVGLGYNLAINDKLNIDFLIEKEQDVSGTAGTVTVNYDFGNNLTSYAEFTEDKPKMVVGLSKSF
jgi:uncharacterized protein (TIGR02001 family)